MLLFIINKKKNQSLLVYFRRITTLLKKRFLAQQESTQADTSSQTSINENSSNCDHVSYENVHEVECVVNNSNPQKTTDEEVNLST